MSTLEAEAEKLPPGAPTQVRIFTHADELVVIRAHDMHGRHSLLYDTKNAQTGYLYPSIDIFHNYQRERNRAVLVREAIAKLTQSDIEILGLVDLANELRYG